MDQLLTVEQVADWLQVRPRTVYQWVHERYIPAVKIGSLVRFSARSVAEWVRKREVPGRGQRRPEIEIN